MAQMGQLYRFYLTYNGQTVESTPTNWDGMELQVNRTDNVVNRSISLEFEFYGAGATLLRLADATESHNALVYMRIDKRQEDWSYIEFKTMKADMITYTEENEFSLVSFMEQSLREQIEDKADIVYEIDVDEAYNLSYTGIDRIRENIFTATTGNMIGLYGYYLPKAYRTTSQYSQAITWSDNDYATTYDTLRFKAIAARPIRLSIDLNITIKKKITLSKAPTWATIGLYLRRNGIVSHVFFLNDNVSGSFVTPNSGYENSFSTGYDGLLNTDGWRKSTFKFWGLYIDITPQVGDEYFLGYKAEGTGVFSIETIFTGYSVFDVTETADSVYLNRITPVIHHERIIEKLIAKMGITNADGTPKLVGSGITYNLPTEAVNDGFVIAYGGTDSLLQKTTPKMSLSMNQAMSLSKMRFAACLRYTDTDVVVDLVGNQYNDSVEVEIDPINSLKIALQDTLIYGSVEVSYKTDEKDANNVANEIICKNTYTIPSGKGEAYSLSTDIICSPYCIEARIEALLNDDTNSDTKDNSIFAFAVQPITNFNVYGYYRAPIVGDTVGRFYEDEAKTIEVYPGLSGYVYIDLSTNLTYRWWSANFEPYIAVVATQLDKRHLGIDASYYNIPLSPMRCVKAHAKSIGTSCYNGTPNIVFASSERNADATTKMTYEANYTDEKVPDASITALFSTPYYLPYTCEFNANWKIPSLSALQNNVLYTAFEQKTGRTVKGFINILTLQLSKVESQQINLLAHEI